MCDFHSILGVAIGDTYEIRHDSSNSHAGMAGKLENKPNRKPVMFEAEASAEKLLTCVAVDDIKSSIIRNYGECPEQLVRKIVAHYQKLKEALTDGSHLESYFAEDKYCDVWNKVIERGGIAVTLPATFRGNLAVSGSAKLDATALTEVGGNLTVYGSDKLAKLDALTKVGGNLAVSGSAKLDAPELTEVGGYLNVYGSAKLDALKKVSGNLVVYGSAKLDALTKVSGNLVVSGGNLAVSGSAKLDATALTEVGGYLVVYGSAKLDALTKVGGNIAVYGSAKLDAPALKSVDGRTGFAPRVRKN